MSLKEKVLSVIPQIEPYWGDTGRLFSVKVFPAGSVLLEAGDISKYVYIVLKGCLRIFIIKEDGTEVTVQFFFEKHKLLFPAFMIPA